MRDLHLAACRLLRIQLEVSGEDIQRENPWSRDCRDLRRGSTANIRANNTTSASAVWESVNHMHQNQKAHE